MREIKFRAWDGKKMIFANIDKWHRIYDMVECFRANNGELMQYTGLKDKNGKEIYEGDILDFDEREWGGEFRPEAITMENLIGKWEYCGTLSDVGEYRKVIGNIYENPDLLS